MTPRTPQCEVFCPLLSSSEHSGVPEDSQPPTFPSVGLHPHTWPKWGCDRKGFAKPKNICMESNNVMIFKENLGIKKVFIIACTWISFSKKIG
jgi:hypothetical protein